MAYTFYTFDNQTQQFKLTADGIRAVNILNQYRTAYDNNVDFVFAWFKGMDVYPKGDAVLEFADELQEYSKLNSKKNLWSSDLNTSEFIKWNYYAQESRTNKVLPSGNIVNNIVDDSLIEDRILQLKDNTFGFVEYFDRQLIYDYSNVFNNGTNILYNDINLFGNTFLSSGEYQSTRSREEILAWFKGVNLQPTQQVLEKYRPYIQAYLLDPRKTIDTNIDVGIFLDK